MASPRRILSERGLTAHKGRGQNFLSDPNMARAIVARSGAGEGDTVLEIGPGLGALTVPLLELGARVAAVEVDQGLSDYLREEIAPRFPDRLAVVTADVLEVDLSRVVKEAFGADADRFHVVGNLPYVISTPILIKLVEHRRRIVRAILMLQKEMADRVVAGPGSKDYGRLSVLMGYHAEVRAIMNVGPDVFFPKPKVGSKVITIEFKPAPEPAAGNPAVLEKVVAAAFSRRRKTLRNALQSAYPPDRIDQALAETGIDPGRRAETLSVDEFVRLANWWTVHGFDA